LHRQINRDHEVHYITELQGHTFQWGTAALPPTTAPIQPSIA